MKIWANCIVHNEENFIWYALMSIVDYVDKILVWDSGSSDKTVEIIKEAIRIKEKKIEFKEVGTLDKNGFTKMRQAQLDQSDCDWILILDGDEVWWNESIEKVVSLIQKKGNEIDAIVNPFYSMVGDIYHYQSEECGRYEIAGRRGHLTVRAFSRRIPGLHLAGPYGEETFVDGNEIPIQKRDFKKMIFMDDPFVHLTHLQRSSSSSHGKYKIDKGIKVKSNFHFPEVFYAKKPANIPSPWKKRSKLYETLSLGRKIFKI